MYSNGSLGNIVALRLRDSRKYAIAGETSYHSSIWAGGPHTLVVGDQAGGSTELRCYTLK
jgi:hypothetical protein